MTGRGTPPGHRAAAPNALPNVDVTRTTLQLAADPLAVGRPRPLPLRSAPEPHQMCDVAPSLAVCVRPTFTLWPALDRLRLMRPKLIMDPLGLSRPQQGRRR